MRIRFMPQASSEVEGRFAAPDDVRRLFEEDTKSLYLLAFLLTANHERAERCFVSGFEECAQGDPVFQHWARSWARRIIIKNAVRMISPSPRFPNGPTERLRPAVVGEYGRHDRDSAWAAVLALENFERFVFVVSVLEVYSDRECAALLGCTPSEIKNARLRTMQQIADSGRTRAKSQ
jgi:DNA-directed RNA polymerase specialized sigma24 family protein